MSQRISGTIAEAYLRNRGISALHDVATGAYVVAGARGFQ